MFQLWEVHKNTVLEEEKEVIVGKYCCYEDAIEAFKKFAKLTDDIGLSGCYIEKEGNTIMLDYGNYNNYFLIKENK